MEKPKPAPRATARSPEGLRQLLAPDFEKERRSNRQFVTALARGLEVLCVFQPFEGPLSNQEIANRSRLPKPTVSRITYTLTKLGYLEYVEALERYRLGSAVLALGYAFRGGLEVRKLARPHMEEFVARTGATVALCAPYRLSFIILDICSSKTSMRLMLDVGSRIQITSSPATAAYLEALPEADERIIDDLAHATEGEAWAALQEELARCRDEVRETGFCLFPSPMAKNVDVCATAMAPPNQDKLFLFQAYAHNSEIGRKTFRDTVGPQLVHMAEMIKVEAASWNL